MIAGGGKIRPHDRSQGDYRILYEIHDHVLAIVVVRIGHRRDVYRQQRHPASALRSESACDHFATGPFARSASASSNRSANRYPASAKRFRQISWARVL